MRHWNLPRNIYRAVSAKPLVLQSISPLDLNYLGNHDNLILQSSKSVAAPLRSTSPKMISRAATASARSATSLVSRRGFHATARVQSSPYHYPEGPLSNLPFNPRKKTFGLLYWGFMGTGFFAPFGIAVYQTYKPQ